MQAPGSAWERSLRRAEIEELRFHDLWLYDFPKLERQKAYGLT